jgi:phospholipase C
MSVWSPRRALPVGLATLVVVTTAGMASTQSTAANPPRAGATAAPAPRSRPADAAPVPASRTATPIRHLVVLMQGERTFDNYFGTYPGADGIPAGTCQPLSLPRSRSVECIRPFRAHGLSMPVLGAAAGVTKRQLDGGRMDGFVAAYTQQGRAGSSAMGYYDREDLPFTWAAADRYILFDRFFSASPSGPTVNRSYWVSAAPPPPRGARGPDRGYGQQLTIFDRLEQSGVSWRFYVQDYDPKQTYLKAKPGRSVPQALRVPLLQYGRFVRDKSLASHIVDLSQYYRDLTAGTLPEVVFLTPSSSSERSFRSIGAAQRMLRQITTQLMLSTSWSSSAFLWTYDGPGGWFDHVPPPPAGRDARGFRVPALLISPYVTAGRVDHTVLDITSVLRFIEDNWHLPPLTQRDRTARSIAGAFDFSHPPRPAELLPVPPPASGAVVKVNAAYSIYGAAVLLVVLVFAAAAWPRRRVLEPK